MSLGKVGPRQLPKNLPETEWLDVDNIRCFNCERPESVRFQVGYFINIMMDATVAFDFICEECENAR